MLVHRDIDRLPPFRHAVITIGTFDGVHQGHRQIIRQLNEEARACGGESVIITFHPHPRFVLRPGQQGLHLLTTLDEKEALLSALAVDHLVIVPFTPAFSRLSAGDYVTEFLVRRFHPHTIIIGHDHRFGHNREGGIELLMDEQRTHDFRLLEIPPQVVHHLTVSSTKIRHYLEEGRIALANELLGYPYLLSGRVERGDGRGRELGFPTANLGVDNDMKLIPAEGVYAVRVRLPDQPEDRLYAGALNIGRLPTFGGKTRRIEVYILDFAGDIYGQRIELQFHEFLREDRSFSQVDALVDQIREDVREVARRFAGTSPR